MDLTALDLTPMDGECIRCHTLAPMRFVGLCGACRDALHVKYTGEARDIDVEEYVPKVNVTPNAVALKDD